MHKSNKSPGSSPSFQYSNKQCFYIPFSYFPFSPLLLPSQVKTYNKFIFPKYIAKISWKFPHYIETIAMLSPTTNGNLQPRSNTRQRQGLKGKPKCVQLRCEGRKFQVEIYSCLILIQSHNFGIMFFIAPRFCFSIWQTELCSLFKQNDRELCELNKNA